MRILGLMILTSVALFVGNIPAQGQAYGEAPRGEPGDEMIQAYLQRVSETVHGPLLGPGRALLAWWHRVPCCLSIVIRIPSFPWTPMSG